MNNRNPKRILVLGGGFGGVHTAMALERQLPAHANTQITLVSQTNFFLFTPMLHEVAASDLDITHIVSPLRTLLKRTHILTGDVDRIDLGEKRVQVRHGIDRHAHTLEYDQLVIALGSITNFYGLPGLERHALTMKSLGDAIELRNRLIATLEEADNECASGDDGLLTVVVAGGGFAGVETIAAVNDFVRESLRFYPSIDPARVRMVLVHAGPALLPELGPELGGYAQKKLAERGVEIHVNAKVRHVDATRVLLTDGTSVPARLVVWTAGTSPHPLLHELPCALERGRIHVDEMLRVPGYPGVWALGDCAVVPDRRTGGSHPPTAQHALREARTLARNIAATLQEKPCVPFEFRTIGQLAAIGRRTGVARIFGFKFSGFVAWWMWRTIYLGKLPRFEKKLRVAIDWTLDLIFTKDFVQFLTLRAPAFADLPQPSTPMAPDPVLVETAR